MLVSAVSASSFQTVFNTRIKKEENSKDLKDTNINVSDKASDNKAGANKINIFDSINEWKYFCHEQILQGKMDIIA